VNREITGIGTPGGYAEYMRAKASHAIKVPASLTPHEAAPYFCAGVTVYHACKDAEIGAGQSVAVIGVGGLGHLAVQFARVLGADTIAVDVSEQALELARSVGAGRTVDAANPDAVRKIADHGGVHVALVTAPAEEAYALALRCLRRRGKLVVVGIPKNDLTFFADDLVTGEFRIIGSAVGTRDELRAALELAAAGQVRCEVETYPFRDINEVLRRVRNGEIAGRAAVTFTSKPGSR
jgi:propanol-preferring alcohol dehydrogenase